MARICDQTQPLPLRLHGPALVVYNGHANIFNMGELEKTGAARAFLLGLTDAFSLYRTNIAGDIGDLFVVYEGATHAVRWSTIAE